MRATGTYNFLKEIDTSYIFLNIVTAGMGTFSLRLLDCGFPIELIINGFNPELEYIVFSINKSNITISQLKINGIFQAEIKKYIYLIFKYLELMELKILF